MSSKPLDFEKLLREAAKIKNPAARELAVKSLKELSRPKQPRQRSRAWKDPKGYKYLVHWSNLVLLRFLIRKLTESLPKSEYRRKSQLDDAARSAIRNLEEGWKRATTADYLQFVGYTQGSLEEVKGDVRELTDDGFLTSRPGSSLVDLGIDLGEFHRALKGGKGSYRKLKDVKGDYLYRPLTIFYPPLKSIKAEALTYEIFTELANKTDYLLRRLVESLERKLDSEQKGYQVDQARIKGKLRGNG